MLARSMRGGRPGPRRTVAVEVVESGSALAPALLLTVIVP
jgi:hypothetical protein